MKALLLLIVSIFLLISAGAQTTEFLSTKDFQNEKKKLADGINSAKKTATDAKKTLSIQNQTLDSLSKLLSVYQVQLAKSNDSLSSLSVKVIDLQNQIDQKKTISRNTMIFIFALILLLFLLAFIYVFMIKKKSDQNYLSLSEEGAKTNNKVDQGLNLVSEDVKGCKDLIKTTSNDLNQQLKNGLEHFEIRAGHIEQQIKDYTGIIEGKINKTREENDVLLKKQEDKLNSLESLIDKTIKEIAVLNSSNHADHLGMTAEIMENLSSQKNQLEEKIKTLSGEISKLKMK